MRRFVFFILNITLLVLTNLAFSCDDDNSDPNRILPRSELAPPVFVEKSSDTARATSGIQPARLRFESESGILLEWFSNKERLLEGYEVWRTTVTSEGRPVNFQQIARFELGSQAFQIPSLPDTNFLDKTPQRGVTYYYRLRGYSRFGGVSEFSDSTQQYELGTPAATISPQDSIPLQPDSLVVFRWDLSAPQDNGGFCCLKVYERVDLNLRPENCIAVATKQSFLQQDSLRIDFKKPMSSFAGEIGVRTFKPLERGKEYVWFVTFHPRGLDRFLGSPSDARVFRIQN